MHSPNAPAGEKTGLLKPAPGHLVVKTIKKQQLLRFTGSIYQLTEPLVSSPSQGGCDTIVGGCLGQGRHRYIFADATYPES